MALRVLMCVSQGDDSALPGFQALRDACRAGVHRHATLGAALLFSGNCTLMLIEGDEAQVQALLGTLQRLAAALPTRVWRQVLEPGAPGMPVVARALPAGLCRSGYLDDDAACEACNVLHGKAPGIAGCNQEPTAAAVHAGVRVFLSLLAASDHD